MTKKLYDENAYTAQFTATVLSCREQDGKFCVELDETAFFPEGGGQAADTGTLGSAAVLDVQLQGDTVVHTCTAPLLVGETVDGEIDWLRRYDRMQQHSGEHIVSGIVNAMTGYDNVGFHMGADCTTVDFSGKLTDEEIADILKKVNDIVNENRPVRAWYPEKEQLQKLPYRSKKELAGAVRLVEIAGTDLCACCAPHVKSTAEVGPIVFLGRETLHGGTRLQMLCGRRAMEHILAVLEQNRGISAALSVQPHETFAAALRVMGELGALKQQLAQSTKELYAATAEIYRGKGNVLLFRESGDAGKLACAVKETCGGFCAVFVKTESGFRYAVSGENVRELRAALHQKLGGKGGGRPELCQGSVPATQVEIEAFFGEIL